jgi:hypothetical protein
MKQAILTNWTFSRVLRLVLGVVIIIQAIYTRDIPIGIMGLIFTMMPVFNIGCCGAGGCYTPAKKVADATKDVTYEEVI